MTRPKLCPDSSMTLAQHPDSRPHFRAASTSTAAMWTSNLRHGILTDMQFCLARLCSDPHPRLILLACVYKAGWHLGFLYNHYHLSKFPHLTTPSSERVEPTHYRPWERVSSNVHAVPVTLNPPRANHVENALIHVYNTCRVPHAMSTHIVTYRRTHPCLHDASPVSRISGFLSCADSTVAKHGFSETHLWFTLHRDLPSRMQRPCSTGTNSRSYKCRCFNNQ